MIRTKSLSLPNRKSKIANQKFLYRFFVIKDGRAEKRIVQLGQTEGDLIEIRTGLSGEEQVATSNVELLNDGTTVRQ